MQIEISARICGGHGTKDTFEDLVKTINVTRDGLLVATQRKTYFVGDVLDVTAPYWENPTAINTARKARVIRAAIMPDLRYGRRPRIRLAARHTAGPLAAREKRARALRARSVSQSNPNPGDRIGSGHGVRAALDAGA